MTFYVITIFPESLEGYFNSSILKRAQENGLIKINFVNPRDFSEDRHQKVDDRPFGGGPGMVFKVEPIVRAIESLISKISNSKVLISNKNSKLQKSNFKENKNNGSLKNKNIKIILFSPVGKQFDQKAAIELASHANGSSKYTDIIFVCGRYEGIDARLKSVLRDLFSKFKICDSNFKIQEFSIGPFVLTGGELPAAAIIDAVSRYIPGVLGKDESLELARQKGGDERGVGIPVYTRPEVFEYNGGKSLNGIRGKKYRVPKVLLSGDPKKLMAWRIKHAKNI